MPIDSLYVDDELKILNPLRRDLEPEPGSRGFIPFAVKGVNEKQRTVSAYVSTPNSDRHNEVIDTEAFRKWLPTFMENPVMLAGHSHGGADGSPSVIGHWIAIDIRRDGLYGTAKFLKNDELAEAWFTRFVQRAVRAFSVGFIPKQWEMRDFPEHNEGKSKRLRVFTEVELIEISAVAVPANREALVRAADAGSLWPDESRGVSNRRTNKTLQRSVQALIKSELNKALSPDPGGHLHMLIMETVEMTLREFLSGGNSRSSVNADPYGIGGPMDGLSVSDDDLDEDPESEADHFESDTETDGYCELLDALGDAGF